MRLFCHRLTAIAFVLGLFLAFASTVRAGPYEDALARFAAGSFDATSEGINGVTASGNPLAQAVIEALQEGRLFFSAQAGKVFFRDKASMLFDAETGAPVSAGAPTDLAPVRINNRLRREIEAALGALTLMAPDPE